MILGVDIGSTTISAVRLNTGKKISATFYEAHHGQIGKCLEKMASQLDPENRTNGDVALRDKYCAEAQGMDLDPCPFGPNGEIDDAYRESPPAHPTTHR